jgi:hypothetical protein
LKKRNNGTPKNKLGSLTRISIMKTTSNSTQRTKKKMKRSSHMMNNPKPLQRTREVQESKPTEKKDKRRKLQRQKKMTLA